MTDAYTDEEVTDGLDEQISTIGEFLIIFLICWLLLSLAALILRG